MIHAGRPERQPLRPAQFGQQRQEGHRVGAAGDANDDARPAWDQAFALEASAEPMGER